MHPPTGCFRLHYSRIAGRVWLYSASSRMKMQLQSYFPVQSTLKVPISLSKGLQTRTRDILITTLSSWGARVQSDPHCCLAV